MAAYEVLLLNTAVPQIQAAQAGDTYVVPRNIAVNAELTVTGNVGIGTTSPTQRLHIQLPTGLTDGIPFRSRTDGGGEFNLVCADTSIATPLWKLQTGTSEDLAFLSGTSERMRLTSTGLGIGTSSPTNALSVTGSANITGNTTLGDATTDTVTVNGYMGVGGAGASSRSITLSSAALTGTTQEGIRSNFAATSAATSAVRSFVSVPATADAVFTVANLSGFYAANGAKGASSTVTNQHGLYIEDQTQGTNNFGITSLVSSGANKWNIYASGTAANYFAGNVGIGTTSPGAQLDIAGTVHVTNADSFISNATTCLFARTSGSGSGIFSEAGHLVLQPRSSAARSIIFGTGSTTATERARFDGVGNFLLNGTISPASGVGTFAIFNGTAPTGSVANGIILYAEDVSSSSELKVRDEAGNVTTLSPHNFSLIPEGPSEDMAWAYYSEKGGKRINVDMLKLARMVEKLTGEKLVYEN